MSNRSPRARRHPRFKGACTCWRKSRRIHGGGGHADPSPVYRVPRSRRHVRFKRAYTCWRRRRINGGGGGIYAESSPVYRVPRSRPSGRPGLRPRAKTRQRCGSAARRWRSTGEGTSETHRPWAPVNTKTCQDAEQGTDHIGCCEPKRRETRQEI